VDTIIELPIHRLCKDINNRISNRNSENIDSMVENKLIDVNKAHTVIQCCGQNIPTTAGQQIWGAIQ
jgi:hypothetical protein